MTPAWVLKSESLALHCWLTGDEASRTTSQRLANWLASAARASEDGWMGNDSGDDRAKARTLTVVTDVLQQNVGATTY